MTLHLEDCPEDLVREAENEARCALATLVAIEALRNDDETDWWEGTATDILGYLDNLLSCARTLADHHRALVGYIRQETDTLNAGWKVKREAARKAAHPTEEPATT